MAQSLYLFVAPVLPAYVHCNVIYSRLNVHTYSRQMHNNARAKKTQNEIINFTSRLCSHSWIQHIILIAHLWFPSSHFHVICKWHEMIQVTHLCHWATCIDSLHIIIISPLCRIAMCRRHRFRSPPVHRFHLFVLFCFILFSAYVFRKIARQQIPNHVNATRNRPDDNQFKSMNCHQKCSSFVCARVRVH